MNGTLGWRWLWLIACAACASIRVVAPDASAASDGASTADGHAEVQSGADTAGDAAGAEVSPPCQSDDDCRSTKGKSACKVPVCEKASGVCQLQLRATGEICVAPGSEATECHESRCDASGSCVPLEQSDGTACGLGACGKVCKSGSCVAATPADFDDNNPCTTDYCDQGKIVAHDAITNLAMTCDDADLCTVGDVCVGGQCLGAANNCADGIDCTFDTCAKKTGCQHLPKLDACSDGDPCTKDACSLAEGCTVVGFGIDPCDDNNPCSVNDLCDGGVCKGSPSADPSCACSGDDQCLAMATDACGITYKCDVAKSVCVPKVDSVVVCDTSKDGVCQKTACDPASGACVTLAVAGTPTCDDGDACTASSACVGGACVGAKTSDCSDNNPCTADGCDPVTGCSHLAVTAACDDGSLCTGGDACVGGACVGAKKSCDDKILCTFDSCDPKDGSCKHAPVSAACNDENPCTTDSCDAGLDCLHANADAATCDDGNVCTKESCKNGKCVAVVVCDCLGDADCNDANPCTSDSCLGGKCVAKNADGAACSPPDKCQKAGSGTCTGGACQSAEVPIDCSGLSDACNTGTCDAATGKCQSVAKPAGSACDDGNGCTVADSCKGGKCAPGAPVVCPIAADKPCLAPECTATGAASHTCTAVAKAKGTPCSDGLYCTGDDACDAGGGCVGAPLNCPAVGVCFVGVCDEKQQACATPPAGGGTACEDGLFCTVGDTCDGKGGCQGGAAKQCIAGPCATPVCDEPTDQCLSLPTPECCSTAGQCDDGFACTADTCSAAGTCDHSPTSSTCCSEVVWQSAFDAGLGNGMVWANSTGSVALGWQLRKGAQSHSAPWALYYGDPQQNNFDFGNSAGVVSTPWLTLPLSLTSPTVQFECWLDTEDSNVFDKLTVTALYDNGGAALTAVPLWSKPQGLLQKTWQHLTIKLPFQLWGETVRFEFKFATGDAIDNVGEGVYLDDISVQATCL